jgi:hypothetical protein
MKIYCNGFWSGFIEKTNPVHCDFFIELCNRIWNTKCELGDKEDSDILLESIFSPSCLKDRSWKYSILFSGESRIYSNTSDYTLVLYGQRNHDNSINCPLFIPYIYCNNLISSLDNPISRSTIAQNKVLAIISNPGGDMRNTVLHALETQGIEIVYAGNYKNNIGGPLKAQYNTNEFLDYVSQFKFILTMENSREDTYITEKICHGMLADIVPIYWGSKRVCDYFNPERFINIDSTNDIPKLIKTIQSCFNNESEWNAMVAKPILSDGLWRNIDAIAADCRAILNASGAFKKISMIQFICNREFEPVRYERLEEMVSDLDIDMDKVKFCCPTYKHTITSDIFSRYVRTPMNHLLPGVNRALRKSELSLFLNLISNLKEIDKNYLDGIFFIFESDIRQKDNIFDISEAIDILLKNTDKWDMIHLGYGGEDQMWKYGYIEDFTDTMSSIRFERRYGTRCTDSLLFTKRGIEELLAYFTINDDYAEPMDHYISRYLEHNKSYNHYWSEPSYFIQMSNYEGEQSTIQGDTN